LPVLHVPSAAAEASPPLVLLQVILIYINLYLDICVAVILRSVIARHAVTTSPERLRFSILLHPDFNFVIACLFHLLFASLCTPIASAFFADGVSDAFAWLPRAHTATAIPELSTDVALVVLRRQQPRYIHDHHKPLLLD
jgi:hypothetical protein